MIEKETSSVASKGTKVHVWDTWRKKLLFIEINEVQKSKQGSVVAKLAAPYDERMGLFNLDTLNSKGKDSAQGIDVYLPWRWKQDEAKVMKEVESSLPSPDDQKNRKLLGIPSDSHLTEKMVGDAAKSKAKKVHPDVGGTNAEMQAVNDAREVLTAKAKEQKRSREVWGKGD